MQSASAVARETVMARVVSVNSESKTVKCVQLDVGRPFPFYAGQWIDVFVPDPKDKEQKLSAGFSLTSNPLQPAFDGKIAFAVKRTSHPLTHFIHDDLYIGDSLEVSSEPGGDVYFTSDMGRCIVMIGGGIGITPVCIPDFLFSFMDLTPDPRCASLRISSALLTYEV